MPCQSKPAPQHFRSFDLPPELRNNIYEQAFTTPVTITDKPYNPPSLLIANKQTYNEAIMMFYRNATFYFTTPKDFREWHKSPPNKFRAVITKLRYDIAGKIAEWNRVELQPGEAKYRRMVFMIWCRCGRGWDFAPEVMEASVRLELGGEVVWTRDPVEMIVKAFRRSECERAGVGDQSVAT